MDEKLKSEKTCKKEHFSMFVAYFESNQSMLVNAPFRSQIFKIFVASGCKGALTP